MLQDHYLVIGDLQLVSSKHPFLIFDLSETRNKFIEIIKKFLIKIGARTFSANLDFFQMNRL